jgi:multidrug efflux pump subunit AcrB
LTLEYRGAFKAGERAVAQALGRVPVPPGYTIQTETEGLNIGDAERWEMACAGVLSLCAVVMIIASALESIRAALLVAASVPFSLLGIFALTAWGGVPFGRGGFAAALYLTGIAVSHAVLLADRFRGAPGGKGTREILSAAEAAGTRLRPLLMTTFTTGAGLLPMVFLSGGTPFWGGFALWTLSGLTGLTLFGLLALPVFACVGVRPARMSRGVPTSR